MPFDPNDDVKRPGRISCEIQPGVFLIEQTRWSAIEANNRPHRLQSDFALQHEKSPCNNHVARAFLS